MSAITAEKLDVPGAAVKFFEVSVPLRGSLNCFVAIGTTTGPATPGLPMWMWAACGGPVRPLALSVYLMDLPLAEIVKVAVPVALLVDFGTSDLEFSVAPNLVGAAAVAGT